MFSSVENQLIASEINSRENRINSLLSSKPTALEWLLIQSHRSKITKLRAELKSLENE